MAKTFPAFFKQPAVFAAPFPMSRPRRLWPLFPVVVIGLFLALCGWRNRHLPNDPEDVWLAMADSFPPATQTGTTAVSTLGSEEIPRLFQPGTPCVLGLEYDWEKQGKARSIEPVPASLLKKIVAHRGGTTIKNFAGNTEPPKNGVQVLWTRVEFRDKYEATCYVKWDAGSQAVGIGYIYQGARFLLSRSPLPFGNSQWRVVQYEPLMLTMT